jgi:hypothetical protein
MREDLETWFGGKPNSGYEQLRLAGCMDFPANRDNPPSPDYKFYAEAGFNLEAYLAAFLRFRGRKDFEVLGKDFGFRYVVVDNLAIAVRIPTSKLDFERCFERMRQIATAYKATPILVMDNLRSEDIGPWIAGAARNKIDVFNFQESTAEFVQLSTSQAPDLAGLGTFVRLNSANVATALNELWRAFKILSPLLNELRGDLQASQLQPPTIIARVLINDLDEALLAMSRLKRLWFSSIAGDAVDPIIVESDLRNLYDRLGAIKRRTFSGM